MKSPGSAMLFAALPALLVLALAAAAGAGQVRVNASGFAFSPVSVTAKVPAGNRQSMVCCSTKPESL